MLSLVLAVVVVVVVGTICCVRTIHHGDLFACFFLLLLFQRMYYGTTSSFGSHRSLCLLLLSLGFFGGHELNDWVVVLLTVIHHQDLCHGLSILGKGRRVIHTSSSSTGFAIVHGLFLKGIFEKGAF